jgi:hypothetical protein
LSYQKQHIQLENFKLPFAGGRLQAAEPGNPVSAHLKTADTIFCSPFQGNSKQKLLGQPNNLHELGKPLPESQALPLPR